MRDDEYFAIKDRAAAVLLKLPHITAVGMGGRERNGQATGEIVIKVFVARKKPAADVPPEETIPPSFEGIPTDVVEMGYPTPQIEPGAVAPAAMQMDNSFTDPVRGGGGLAVLNHGGGTLGCILLDLNDATAVYALTNHHVVTKGALSRSRSILHPSQFGGFETLGYAAAGANEPSRDAAVVRLEPALKWLPAVKEIGFLRGTDVVTVADAATQQYQVRKRGARTKLTGGVVIAVGVGGLLPTRRDFDMVIRGNLVSPPHAPSQQVFFSFPGDSGSVVVNDQNRVVALLWGGDKDSTAQFPTSVATPIKVVLERFRKVDNLDLIVATPTLPNPTELNEVQPVLSPAGAPRRSTTEVFTHGDHGHHRPLRGGTQIVAEPLGFANSATLGCVVTTVGNPGEAYILTSHAGLTSDGIITPTTDTDVGQPDNSDSCSLCCKNTVGEFAKGGLANTAPTAALVKVKEDQKWLAEIMHVGTIGNLPPPLAASDIGSLQVKKCGAGSRLTGGVVTAVGGIGGVLPAGVRPEAMIIRPNPNTFRPGEPICFSHNLDRGALVVNKFNQPVALLYDEIEIPEGSGVFHGVATPIKVVLDQLNALADIEVEIATANSPDQVHTTTSRTVTEHDASTPPVVAGREPARDTAAGFPIEMPVPAGALAWLQEELSQSTAGRLAIAMWSDHRGEIRHLIDHNRKVATVWHRSGGPALLQAFVRALHAPSTTIPASVNGLPTATCLDRICAAFCRHGSPALQSDVAQVRSQLPSIAGLSLSEILAALDVATRPAAHGY